MDVPPREDSVRHLPSLRFEASETAGRPSPTPLALVERADPGAHSEEEHVDAKRLAQMLVTDIAYADLERLSRAREERTVLRAYAGDIRRAFEFYRSRVGEDLARDTAYFRDAIESILATRR